MRGPAPPENQRGVAEPTNQNAEARSHPPIAGRVVATPRGARMRREYDRGTPAGPGLRLRREYDGEGGSMTSRQFIFAKE